MGIPICDGCLAENPDGGLLPFGVDVSYRGERLAVSPITMWLCKACDPTASAEVLGAGGLELANMDPTPFEEG